MKPNFFDLDPENEHGCHCCQNSFIEFTSNNGVNIANYRCKLHGDVGMDEKYNYVRPNDCKDWFSKWQNDYRRRYDLERQLKNNKK